jgi:hypothetical protein
LKSPSEASCHCRHQSSGRDERTQIGFVGCVIFPTNEYNDGHPYLRQWLLLVLVPMIVYIAKRLIVLVPKFAEKSPFLNAGGALLAVSFSL